MTHKIPIGLQDFSCIREGGFLYVDKTPLIYRLANEGNIYFLSRPRRFGKSLLISVLKELFEGHKTLFEGLWIHDRWNWDQCHPVVRISLGAGDFQSAGGASMTFFDQVNSEALRHGVEVSFQPTPELRLQELLRVLHQRGSRPVVLIDEYDKPVLQALESSGDPDLLEANRRALKAFYSCLKEAPLRMLFITGVSRLTKTSVFSELNHLEDISGLGDYHALCGLTSEEIQATFATELQTLAEAKGLDATACLEELRRGYNGFCFAPGAPSVFNPYSTLLCLKQRKFGHYWSESGTPQFLVRLMEKTGVTLADVDGVALPPIALSDLDPSDPDPLSLLLQTGYLSHLPDSTDELFRIGFPNAEVRTAFVEHLLTFGSQRKLREIAPRALALGRSLQAGDVEAFLNGMKWVFQSIPYQLDEAHEKRYHGLFHAMAILACSPPGIVLSEASSASGRSDCVVDLPGATWIFEFKLDQSPAAALQQIEAQNYAARWLGQGKPVWAVGVNFASALRNIQSWEFRKADVPNLLA